MLKKSVSYILLISYVIVAFSVKYSLQFMKEVLEYIWKDRRTVLPWTLAAILGWLIFSILICVLR